MYADPCEIEDCVEPAAVAWWSWLKGILGLLLLLLGIILLLTLCNRIVAPVTNLPDGEILAGNYEINGTASPNAIVEIQRDGQRLGTTAADANGRWAYSANYEPGEYQVRGNMVDGGTLLAAGAAGAITAWALPTLGDFGGAAEPGTFAVSGTGTPGSTLDILSNGELVDSVTVGSDGNWTLDTEVIEGTSYDYSARLVNSAGETLGETRPVTVRVPVDEPAALMVDGGPQLGLFGALAGAAGLASGSLALDGTGEPGAIIQLFADGEPIGETTVGADGTWSFDDDIELATGENNLTVQMLGPDGNLLGESDPFGVNVSLNYLSPTIEETDILDGSTVVISGSGQPGATLDVIVDGEVVDTVTVGDDGSWTYSLANFEPGEYNVFVRGTDDEENSYDSGSVAVNVTAPFVDPTLAIGEIDDSGAITLEGTGQPGSELEIVIDGEVVDTVTVGEDGSWTYSLGLLDPGAYTIVARDTDVNGNPADSEAVMLNVTEGAAALIIGETVIGDNGSVLFSGTGEPGSQVTLFLNGVPFTTVDVDENGAWSFDGFLPAGDYTLTAAQVVDGETGPETAGIDFNIDLPDALAYSGDAGSGSIRVTLADLSGAGDGTDGGDSTDGDSASGVDLSAFLDRPTVSLILDSSWSMTFPLDSSDEADRLTANDPNSRIAIAKASLLDFVEDNVIDGDPISVRAFGNIEGNLACRTDLMYPLQAADRDELSTVISGIVPQFNANTAIAASLAQTANDLADADEDKERIIVLLTDGDETCNGDPAAEIQNLVDAGFDVTVNIIGFAIADVALQNTFEEWATLGNGTYYDAQDATALEDSLQQATAVTYQISDQEGNIVQSGLFGDESEPLEPGIYTVVLVNGAGDDIVFENVVVVDGAVTDLGLR